MITVVQGDHFERPVQLTKNNVPFAISPTAVIRARAVHLATGNRGEEITVTGAETGSNWPSSLIVPSFVTANTTSWTVGRSKIEIEVEDPAGVPTTWFVNDIMVLPQTLT